MLLTRCQLSEKDDFQALLGNKDLQYPTSFATVRDPAIFYHVRNY